MSVDVVIEGSMRIRAVANEEGLLLQGRGLDRRIPWEAVSGAGLVRLRMIDLGAGGPELPKALPGMSRLAAAAGELTGRTRLLMIARSRARGRPRAFTLPLPVEDPNAQLLVDELKRRLGPRWHGEDREQRALKKELGAAYPLWYWPVGLVFVLSVGILTVVAAGAWAFLTGGDPQGHAELTHARWWSFGALAVWLGLCALLFLLVRRALGEDHSWRYAVPIPFVLLLAVLTPPAVAALGRIYDSRFSELGPGRLVALALWLALVLVAARFVRKLLD